MTNIDQQLETFETLLQGTRLISIKDVKLYAKAVRVCTGEVMVIRPVPGSMNWFMVLLPY